MDALRSLYSWTIDKEEAGQAKSDTDEQNRKVVGHETPP